MVNAKERRIQKSRDRNPLWPGNKNKRKSEDAKEEIPTKRFKTRKVTETDSNEKSYAGTISKLGQDKLRSTFNLKSQAELHMRTVKKQKKVTKTMKQLQAAKKAKTQKIQDNMPVRYIDLLYIFLYTLIYYIFHSVYCYTLRACIFQYLILIFLHILNVFFTQ